MSGVHDRVFTNSKLLGVILEDLNFLLVIVLQGFVNAIQEALV